MTARATKEWIGATPDSRIPPRVRLRVFDRFHGVCWLSGRKIRAGEKWECHHAKALIHGGENRETNLVPVLTAPHKVETAKQVAEKSKLRKKRMKHVGITSRKGRPMAGSRASGWKQRLTANGTKWERRT